MKYLLNYLLLGSVQEFIQFASKTIVERTTTSTRQSVKQDVYMCHVYVRADNLAAVLIADHEYPGRGQIRLMQFHLDVDFPIHFQAASLTLCSLKSWTSSLLKSLAISGLTGRNRPPTSRNFRSMSASIRTRGRLTRSLKCRRT